MNIPPELRAHSQWVVWRRETRNGKATKVPYRASAPTVRADSTKPTTWDTYETAASVAGVDGIGFVFSADDPYVGIDVDDCVDPATGEVHPKAAEIVQRLGGYAEWSPSGTGLHVIVEADLRTERHSTKSTPWGGKFEVYDRGRFFTMTGRAFGACPTPWEMTDVDWLIAELLPPRPKTTASSNGTRRAVHLDDHELLAKMFAAKNGARVQALYHSSGGEDPSADDQALCNTLAFWCAGDPDRIDRLFRNSGRMRDKWDERRGDRTYGQRTIDTAIAGCRQFYDPSHNGKAASTSNEDDPQAAMSEWDRISVRWGLAHNPIVTGKSRGDIAAGKAILYLELKDGRQLRFPRLGDLFSADKHTLVVSTIARTRFKPVSKAEATDIAQELIALCGGRDKDPCDEVRGWITEFVALIGAELDVTSEPGENWTDLAEYKQLEAELRRDRRDIPGKSVLFRHNHMLWLPATPLKTFSESQLSWDDFDLRLEEAGWIKRPIEKREPATRQERAEENKTGKFKRRFYVGEDN